MWIFEPTCRETFREDFVREAADPRLEFGMNGWIGETAVLRRMPYCCPFTTLSERHILEKCFGCHVWGGPYGFGRRKLFIVGREGKGDSRRSWNGVQTGGLCINSKHVSIRDISPYVVPGDPLAYFAKDIMKEILGKGTAVTDKIQAIALGCVWALSRK